jgi:hypothetical protein
MFYTVLKLSGHLRNVKITRLPLIILIFLLCFQMSGEFYPSIKHGLHVAFFICEI